MTDNYEIRNPINFVAGTVGGPGDRIFYLQAQGDGSVLTLKLEKDQRKAGRSQQATEKD